MSNLHFITRLATLLAVSTLAATPACAQADAASAPVAASTQPAALQVGASTTTSSGLVIKLLRQGKGASPSATDTVKVHYRGTFPDGKEFDSSYSRGAPLEFPLNRVIKCWTEGVQRLQIGAKAQLICPPAIAYGQKGAGGGVIPPNATLHFEVELLGITPSR